MRRVVAMKPRVELVTGADRRMAQASASRSRVLSGVSRGRSILSLFVQARGVLKKAASASSVDRVRSDARKRRAGKALAGVKSRTWCRSVSDNRPRSKIGRCRVTWEGDLLSGSKNSYMRDPGRTSNALRDVGKGCQQGNPDSGIRAHQAGEEAADRALQVPDLGPGQGTRGPSPFSLATDIESTSVIRKAHGNGVPMRTLMACSDSTSPKAPTCRCIHPSVQCPSEQRHSDEHQRTIHRLPNGQASSLKHRKQNVVLLNQAPVYGIAVLPVWVSKYPLSRQNELFDENVETVARLRAKSFISNGMSHNHANGTQNAMTTNSAGKIRRALRS